VGVYKIKKLCIAFMVLLLLPTIVQAVDTQVWQGQYHTGKTFHEGTFDFQFDVYDKRGAGNLCYTNTTQITTTDFGHWITEQKGVAMVCNDADIDYFLEIIIDGKKQPPRRFLPMLKYFRKDIPQNLKNDIIISSTLLKVGNVNFTEDVTVQGIIKSSPIKMFGGISVDSVSTDGLNSPTFLIKNTQSSSTSATTLTAENFDGDKVVLSISDRNSNFSGINSGANAVLTGLIKDANMVFSLVEGFGLYSGQDFIWSHYDINNFPDIIEKRDMQLSPYKDIRFQIISEENRFAIVKKFPDWANFQARSQIIGDSLNLSLTQNNDINISSVVCSEQGFINIDCDSDLTGSDLGVQDDIEAKGDLFVTNVNSTGNLTVIGSVKTRKHFNVNNNSGITNTSNFHVCKGFQGQSDNCNDWCTLQINGGIITGCV
jgi:hypothetical protein